MKRLLNELCRADLSCRLIPRHSSVLIALSGGPDSVCLARVLLAWRRSRKLRLAAAHVNHGLRAAADSDERWVREFCKREGLEFFRLKANVRRRMKAASESTEEAARRERYRVLTALAKKEGFSCLATAHTADDQAETVLMRIASGSGLWGLAAIPAARTESGVRIVRPLLGISKAEVLAALRRASISYRTDRSNASARFLRNRVRNDLMPYLKQTLNVRAAEHLAELAADAWVWRDWAERAAEDFMARHAFRRIRTIRMSILRLRQFPEPLRAPLYFKICEDLTGGGQTLRREHIRQIECFLQHPRQIECRLVRGLSVRRSSGPSHGEIIWVVAR